MVEASLIIVIFLLSCVIGVLQYTSIKEREKLLKMLMARNLQEVTDNEYTQKIKPQKQVVSDIVEVNPEEDTIFDKAIKAQIEYGKRTEQGEG